MFAELFVGWNSFLSHLKFTRFFSFYHERLSSCLPIFYQLRRSCKAFRSRGICCKSTHYKVSIFTAFLVVRVYYRFLSKVEVRFNRILFKLLPYSSPSNHAFPVITNDAPATYSTAQSNKSSVYSGNLAVPIKPDNFVQATNMAPPLNNSTPPNQYPVQISQSHQHLTSDIYPKMYTSNDQNGAYRMTRSSE